MRVAVITWDGGSNRQPFEALGRALVDRGATVHALSHEAHRELFEGLGAAFEPLPVGEKPSGFRPTLVEERERVTRVWLSKENADAVAAMLDRQRFDAALVDVSMLSAFVGCEATSTRFVAIHHSLPGVAWSGPRRNQFESFVQPINGVRQAFSLSSATGFGELISSAAAHIVPTAAALDEPAPWALPLHYVGPLQPAAMTIDTPLLPPRFALVSFSTTWQRQVHVLQRTIDALSGLDRPVVVTTGPSVDPSEVVPAANTIVTASLPHASILDRVDVVVTHAGHGTVLSALGAGVPLVCMPMGRDQHDVTRRVVAVGAGVEIDPDHLEEELLAAVQRVVSQPTFTDAARSIAESIAAQGGLEEALAVIERLGRRGDESFAT